MGWYLLPVHTDSPPTRRVNPVKALKMQAFRRAAPTLLTFAMMVLIAGFATVGLA